MFFSRDQPQQLLSLPGAEPGVWRRNGLDFGLSLKRP
jgi:hypothetical protein